MAQPMDFIRGAGTVAHTLHRALLVHDDAPLFGTITRSLESSPKVTFRCAREVLTESIKAASVLQSLGLKRRAMVGICARNSPEWLIADFGAALNDMVVVGMLPSWPREYKAAVLMDADIECIICDETLAATFLELRDSCKELRHIVVIRDETSDARGTPNGAIDWHQAMAQADPGSITTLTGVSLSSPPFGRGFGHPTLAVEDENEVATLIYSSGTSGTPKGVTISKRRWKTDQLAGVGNVGDIPLTVCHQELGHGCDRGLCWQAALSGSSIVFVRHSYEEVLEDMQVVKPNFLMAMSHFWTRLHVEHEEHLMTLARQHVSDECEKLQERLGTSSTPLSRDELELLALETLQDPLQSAKLKEAASAFTRQRTGGCLNMLITGGSHTSTSTIEFMQKTFVRPEADPSPRDTVGVHNAYGSTEFPGISVDGNISPLVQLELVDVPEMGYFSTDLPFPRGEIRVRNKDGTPLSSYWRRPEETQKVFSDGWFYTGDIGLIDDKEKLHLIDRRSNLIELYVNGRSIWVPFAELELVYSACPAVHQVFLYGDRNADCVLACVVPRVAWIRKHAQIAKHSLATAPLEEILRDQALQTLLENDILEQLRAAGSSAKRAEHELPGAVVLSPDPWTIEGGELSASGKIRRSVLSNRFRHLFEAAYAGLETARAASGSVLKPSLSDPATLPPENSATSESESKGEVEVTGAKNTEPSQLVSLYREHLASETAASKQRPKLLASPFPASGDMIEFVFDTERAIAEGLDPKKVKAAQDALEAAKLACINVRNNLRRWQEEREIEFRKTFSAFNNCVQENREAMHHIAKEAIQGSDAHLSECLLRLSRQTMQAQTEAWRNFQKVMLAKGKELPAITKALYELRVASDVRLRQTAREAGLQVPFHITSGLWAVPVVRAESFDNIHRGAGEGGLGSSLGDVHIWCDWCACTIESDLVPSGQERMHSVDSPNVEFCLECFKLMQDVAKKADTIKMGAPAPALAPALESSIVPVSAAASSSSSATASYPQDPSATSVNAPSPSLVEQVKSLFPHCQEYFSKEKMAIYWMQDIVKSAEFGKDTPASFINNAFSAYGDRLALGFADPTVLELKDPSIKGCNLQSSPLASAASIQLHSHDSFLWITYAQLGYLSRRMAQGLVSLPGIERGDHIGICGYNTIEWSAADFACALAGMVVVGLHTTYDCKTATEVINRADIKCIFLVQGKLQAGPKKQGVIPEWSWDAIATACPNVKHIIVLDGPVPESAVEPLSAPSAPAANSTASSLAPAEGNGNVAAPAEGNQISASSLPEEVGADGSETETSSSTAPNEGAVESSSSSPSSPEPPPVCPEQPQAPPAAPVTRLISLPESSGSQPATPKATFSSALDMVSPARTDLDSVDLGDPYSHRGSGEHKIFTIFFTSGSTGIPKGVMCSASAFVNDIRGRVFLTPLVTASYIPLSHTSDRMKLWEFLGNGGRVGFCAYAASNWLEHEQSKKSAMVRSNTSETNNVEGLMRQIQCLSPVGMACPPRVWNGLFALFKSMLQSGTAQNEARDAIATMFGQRIKTLFTGGAPTSEEVKDFVRWVFPRSDFHDSYGTTESGAITEDGRPMKEKGVEVALLDVPESGFSVSDKPYPRGEIIVRGPNMTSGYYKDPKATHEQYLEGGWYRTGDLGMITSPIPEGSQREITVTLGSGATERACIFEGVRYTVVERLAAVASLRDGEVVYPSQIEALLEGTCPLVHQAFVTVSKRCNCLMAVVVLKEDILKARGDAIPSAHEVLSAVSETLTAQKRPEHEIPRAVLLSRAPFTVENGLLNSQLKKARKAISIYALPGITKLEEDLLRTEEHPPARCCSTHALFTRDPEQDNEEQRAMRNELSANSKGPTWAVLIAGETSSMMKPDKAKTRPGKYLGGHSSLEQIGNMYDKIADFIPRERIIVIAQLKETIEWLTEAARDETSCEKITGTSRLVNTMRERLKATLSTCERLIKDGGADYDFDLVNPGTVLNVLSGKSSERIKKVVPHTGVGTLMLIINSHGNNHRVSHDHRSYLWKHSEWYFHLPYPCPPEDLGMYDFSCYTSYAKPEELDLYSPECILYAQMLFACYHNMLKIAPERKILSVYQFCLSGGATRFMDLHSYRSYYNTHRWPMCVIATSGDYESSLASFLPLFGNALRASLSSKRQVTLRQLYQEVEAEYWSKNESVSLFNSYQADCLEHLEEPLTLGRIRMVEGSDVVGSMPVTDLL